MALTEVGDTIFTREENEYPRLIFILPYSTLMPAIAVFVMDVAGVRIVV